MKPAIIENVVVLPAPFGPMRPKTEPMGTLSESALTATVGPKRRVSVSRTMAEDMWFRPRTA